MSQPGGQVVLDSAAALELHVCAFGCICHSFSPTKDKSDRGPAKFFSNCNPQIALGKLLLEKSVNVDKNLWFH